MLRESFQMLLENFVRNSELIDTLWLEIEESYSANGRYYHSLQHLENLLVQLAQIKPQIENWNAILFSLYYHDIVYNPQQSDNEEKSAELAGKRMRSIAVPEETIELCKEQILATKSHLSSTNNDTNYFTDADLSILGQAWEIYESYSKNVRKEYAIYPDSVYIPGRRRVLEHFLTMDQIFKTDIFYHKFEHQAKRNLERELVQLKEI